MPVRASGQSEDERNVWWDRKNGGTEVIGNMTAITTAGGKLRKHPVCTDEGGQYQEL